jgi:hypothetical protein
MSVAVDDLAGGELAARHLIDLGHRHLAFVGDEASAEPVRDRLLGVRKAIAETPVDVRLDILPAELTVEAGRARGEELAALPAHRRPTAVTSATDPLAFGVLQSLLQHGIRVPADVSLVGYDDIPFARYLSVPLTTVRRPHYEMGTVAAQMLTGVLAGVAPEQRHVIFQPEFVLRDSTDSPTAGAIEDLDNEHLAQQTLIGRHSPSRCRRHQHRGARRLLQPGGSGRPAQCSQEAGRGSPLRPWMHHQDAERRDTPYAHEADEADEADEVIVLSVVGGTQPSSPADCGTDPGAQHRPFPDPGPGLLAGHPGHRDVRPAFRAAWGHCRDGAVHWLLDRFPHACGAGHLAGHAGAARVHLRGPLDPARPRSPAAPVPVPAPAERLQRAVARRPGPDPA